MTCKHKHTNVYNSKIKLKDGKTIWLKYRNCIDCMQQIKSELTEGETDE